MQKVLSVHVISYLLSILSMQLVIIIIGYFQKSGKSHEHIWSMSLLSTNFRSFSTHSRTRLELHGARGSDDAQKLMTSSILALSRHPDVFSRDDTVSCGNRLLQTFTSFRRSSFNRSRVQLWPTEQTVLWHCCIACQKGHL